MPFSVQPSACRTRQCLLEKSGAFSSTVRCSGGLNTFMQEVDQTQSTMQCTCTFDEINIETTTPCPVFNQSQCFSCSVANYSVDCNVIDYQTGNPICLAPKQCFSTHPDQPMTNANIILFVIIFTACFVLFVVCFTLHRRGYMTCLHALQSQPQSDDMSEQIEFINYDTFQ